MYDWLVINWRRATTPFEGEIIGIQYLRGLAACGVVIAHAGGTAAFPKYFGQDAGGLIENSAIGVTLFFVISGFIMPAISLQRSTLLPATDVGTFVRRRFARIVPIMWIAIVAYGCLQLLGRGEVNVGNLVRALFLSPVGDVDPKVIWTLRHELIFYVVFAVSFLLGSRWRMIMVAWIVSPLLIRLFLGQSAADESMMVAILRSVCHPVNLLFGTGLLIGLAWMRWTFEQRRTPFDLLALLAACFVFVLLADRYGLGGSSVRQLATCAAICIPIAVLALYLVPKTVNRSVLLLGNASYSIYLFHPALLSASLGAWALIAPETPVLMVVIGTSLFAVGACILVHLAVERPLVSYASRISQKHRTLAEVQSAQG